jgi:hypothetical protein
LQSPIWLTASSYMGKYLRISSYIRNPFLIYDFATDPMWISLHMSKISFYFISVDGQIAVEDNFVTNRDPSFTRGYVLKGCMGHEIDFLNILTKIQCCRSKRETMQVIEF